MRTIAIATRVIKELLRDKRTLALMFLAPIFILILLNFVFSASQTTDVNVGTVAVTQSLNQDLDQSKHVTVKTYANYAAAKKALNNDHLDAIIIQKNHDYRLTYANTDSRKTTAVKMAFRNALSTRANWLVLLRL